MNRGKRLMLIFVYESICAGALGANVPASLRAEGWAMLSAITDDFRRLPGVEVATLLAHEVGAARDERARFRALAASSDWTLVIAPEFDDHLRSRSQIVLDVGGQLLGSLPAAIEQTGDKWATSSLLASHGVPHPATENLDVNALPRFDPPWVLKPRHGAGSQATFLVRDRADMGGLIDTAVREWPAGEFIVQPCVSGVAASVAVLIGPNKTVPLLPARQYISGDGRFRYEGGSLPLPPLLAQRALRWACQAVARIHGLQGYVGVDLVLGERADGGDDFVIEINPRLTTSYFGLRRLCRQNLAELMLRIVRGDRIDEPTWREGEVEFRPDALDSFSAREIISKR